MKSYYSRLLTLVFGLLGACASTPPAPAPTGPEVWSETPDPVLLVLTPAFELHVRSGKVEMVTPGVNAEAPSVRVIDDIEELRRLYASNGLTWRDENAAEVAVDGWVGLECVRAGQACGRAPEPGSRALVVLRFR